MLHFDVEFANTKLDTLQHYLYDTVRFSKGYKMDCMHIISPSLGISFQEKDLVIFEFVPYMPQWSEHGSWRETARFAHEADFASSVYSQRIVDEYFQDMIMWHWIDMDSATTADLWNRVGFLLFGSDESAALDVL